MASVNFGYGLAALSKGTRQRDQDGLPVLFRELAQTTSREGCFLAFRIQATCLEGRGCVGVERPEEEFEAFRVGRDGLFGCAEGGVGEVGWLLGNVC